MCPRRAFSNYKMNVELHPERMMNKTFEEVLAKDLAILRRKKFAVPDHDPFPKYDLESDLERTAMVREQKAWARRMHKINDDKNTSKQTLTSRALSSDRKPTGSIDAHWKFQNYIYRSLYVDQLRPWLERGYELGKNLLVFRYERLNANPKEVLTEILDFLQIPDHAFQAEQLAKSYSPNYWLRLNKGKKRKNGRRQRLQMALDQIENPNSKTTFKQEEPQKEEEEEEEKEMPVLPPPPLVVLRNETRAFLKRLFEPYNQQLAELLGNDEWKRVWDEESSRY